MSRLAASFEGHQSPVVDRFWLYATTRGASVTVAELNRLCTRATRQVALWRGLPQLSHHGRFRWRRRSSPGQPLRPDDRGLDPGWIISMRRIARTALASVPARLERLPSEETLEKNLEAAAGFISMRSSSAPQSRRCRRSRGARTRRPANAWSASRADLVELAKVEEAKAQPEAAIEAPTAGLDDETPRRS